MRACRPQDAGLEGGAPLERRERPARARPRRRGSPGPIPNPAVKPAIAESTAAPGCGRPGRRARAGRFLPGSAVRPPSGGLSFFPRAPPGRRPSGPAAPRRAPPPACPFAGLFCFLGPNQCEGAQTASGVACTVCCRFHYRVLFWFAHFLTLRIPSSPQFLRAEILALVGQIFISSIMRRAVRRLAASACSIGLGETFLRRQSCDAILTFRAQFMMLRMRN